MTHLELRNKIGAVTDQLESLERELREALRVGPPQRPREIKIITTADEDSVQFHELLVLHAEVRAARRALGREDES